MFGALGEALVGQQATGGPPLGPIFLWLAIAIVFLLIGAFVLMWIRRRLLGVASGSADPGLSLHDLRMLRDQGRLSDDEYDRARAALIGQPLAAQSESDSEARCATPGFDLTGEPLPGTTPEEEEGGDDEVRDSERSPE